MTEYYYEDFPPFDDEGNYISDSDDEYDSEDTSDDEVYGGGLYGGAGEKKPQRRRCKDWEAVTRKRCLDWEYLNGFQPPPHGTGPKPKKKKAKPTQHIATAADGTPLLFNVDLGAYVPVGKGFAGGAKPKERRCIDWEAKNGRRCLDWEYLNGFPIPDYGTGPKPKKKDGAGLYGGCGESYGMGYSGGGTRKQFAAAKRNPWLKFLAQLRASRPGIPIDFKAAAREYRRQGLNVKK